MIKKILAIVSVLILGLLVSSSSPQTLTSQYQNDPIQIFAYGTHLSNEWNDWYWDLEGDRVVLAPLAWHTVEATQGTYNWSPIDPLFESLESHTGPIHAVLQTAPCFANDEPYPNSCGRTKRVNKIEQNHWIDAGNFLLAALERYPHIDGIVMWNEPDVDQEDVPWTTCTTCWGGWGDDSAQNYGGNYFGDFLAYVIPLVKAGAEYNGAEFIIPGMEIGGTWSEQLPFFTGMAQELPCSDVNEFQVHAYSIWHPEYPDSLDWDAALVGFGDPDYYDESYTKAKIDYFQALVDTHCGDASDYKWTLSEFNLLTASSLGLFWPDENDCDVIDNFHTVRPEMTAKIAVRALAALDEGDNQIEVRWFGLRDGEAGWRCSNMWYDPNPGSPYLTTAGPMWEFLTDKLQNSKVNYVYRNGGFERVQFRTNTGTLYDFWYWGYAEEASSSCNGLPGWATKAYDVYGNVRSPDCGGGTKYTIDWRPTVFTNE